MSESKNGPRIPGGKNYPPISGGYRFDPITQRHAAKAREKFSVSLANNTKWIELVASVRALDGWQPSYRWKSVMGDVGGWEREWYYHLPCDFVGIEWFDLGVYEYHYPHRQLRRTVDRTPEIVAMLDEIGFTYEVRGEVARIWGYAPMSCEDFPPRKQGYGS